MRSFSYAHVTHNWGRGNHTDIWLSIVNIISAFKYFQMGIEVMVTRKIEVVMPTYNGAFVEEQIHSIFNQTIIHLIAGA